MMFIVAGYALFPLHFSRGMISSPGSDPFPDLSVALETFVPCYPVAKLVTLSAIRQSFKMFMRAGKIAW
jgi:hypothetical protein